MTPGKPPESEQTVEKGFAAYLKARELASASA